MKKSATGLLVVLLLCSLAACTRSVEGESKRWARANSTVDELIVLYPSFKNALEAQRSTAQAAMKAAEAVGNEEQRIKKMAAANQLLTSGFVGQLRDIDRSVKDLRSKMVEVTGQATDESDRQSAKQASESAERVLSEVQAVLKRGAPDPAAAGVVLKKVTNDLDAAERNLDKVARTVSSKRRAAEKAAKAKADSAKAGAAKAGAGKGTQVADQGWGCEYCDSHNKGEANTCHNCGAPRPKAEPKKTGK